MYSHATGAWKPAEVLNSVKLQVGVVHTQLHLESLLQLVYSCSMTHALAHVSEIVEGGKVTATLWEQRRAALEVRCVVYLLGPFVLGSELESLFLRRGRGWHDDGNVRVR